METLSVNNSVIIRSTKNNDGTKSYSVIYKFGKSIEDRHLAGMNRMCDSIIYREFTRSIPNSTFGEDEELLFSNPGARYHNITFRDGNLIDARRAAILISDILGVRRKEFLNPPKSRPINFRRRAFAWIASII